MGDSLDAIRDHLVRVLDWQEAHVRFDKAVDGIQVDRFHYAPRSQENLAYGGNMAAQVKESWGARVKLLVALAAPAGASGGICIPSNDPHHKPPLCIT